MVQNAIRIALLLILSTAIGTRARAEIRASAVTGAAAIAEQTDHIKVAADSLRDAAAGISQETHGGTSEEDIATRAAALFGAANRSDSSAIGPVDLTGWYKPEIHTWKFREENEHEETSVQGLSTRVRRTMNESQVPLPAELVEAYLYGEEMLAADAKQYDENEELPGGVLGVYKYTKDKAIGIFFNQMMKKVQAWVGNEFAAATDVHESAHARDHAKGKLNPVQVRKGETLAYRTEFLWMNLMDPTGQKLSWARSTIGKFATGPGKGPKFVANYLEHLAMIRDFGERDDFDGLVAALGYQDRSENPFRHAEYGSAELGHDGHDCAEHGLRMLTHPSNSVQARSHAAAATVRYVEFPG
ncbi:MAG: hypothetical protein V3S11_03055 [Elusimicrobiota bacterium]